MSIYNINFKKLIRYNIGDLLRQSVTNAWLKVQISGVVILYGLFHKNRKEQLYKLSHRQHVAHLEAVLNDKWDKGLRRIRIAPSDTDYDPIYIYQTAENKPVYLYTTAENKPIPFHTTDETIWGGTDFIVQIPVSIPYNLDELMATVNYYKTPGMGYIIEQI